MAIVVRLVSSEQNWKCINAVSHITVGTRDDRVKPKESNDLLAKWLQGGAGDETGIRQIVLDHPRPLCQGVVKGVASR
jgi:tRNA ligase